MQRQGQLRLPLVFVPTKNRLQIGQTDALFFGEFLKAGKNATLTTLGVIGIFLLRFAPTNFFGQDFEQALEFCCCKNLEIHNIH